MRLRRSTERRRRPNSSALVLAGMLIAISAAGCGDVATDPAMPGTDVAASGTPQATTPRSDTACQLRDGLYTQIPSGANTMSDFMHDLLCTIEDTPAGESIMISTFKIHNAAVTDALIQADQRGVSVQIVVDGKTSDDDMVRKLQQELGSDTTKSSFFFACDKSCAHPGKGVQHAKVIAFSSTKQVVVGSTNLSDDNLFGSASADYVVRDLGMYITSTSFIHSLLDPNRAAASTGTSIDGLSLSFSPYENAAQEPIGKLLRQVSCGPIDGAGDGGNTKIDVAMYDMTWGRRSDVQRLGELAKNGCSVRVLINGVDDQFQPERREIARYLENRGASVIFPAKGPFIMHDKLLAVNGIIAGKKRRVTILGSQNLTRNARDVNTEATLRSDISKDYSAARKHFNAVQRRLAGAPSQF